MSYKDVYERLKDSEDLFHIYEGMTGDWSLDRKEFVEQHKALNSLSDE